MNRGVKRWQLVELLPPAKEQRVVAQQTKPRRQLEQRAVGQRRLVIVAQQLTQLVRRNELCFGNL